IPGEASTGAGRMRPSGLVGGAAGGSECAAHEHGHAGRGTMNSEFSERRLKMVDGQLRTTDVNDAALLDAMLSVPREEFVPRARRALAYIDEDIEVTSDGTASRYLMEPSPFGRLVQLA